MRFTHVFDGLYKLVLIICSLTLFGMFSWILSAIADPILNKISHNPVFEWICIIIGIVYFFGGLYFSAIVISRTILPYWLPTYLYVRTILYTKINKFEADRVSFLFDGSQNGKWYPLSSLRKLPKDKRREALFLFTNQVATANGWIPPFKFQHNEKEKNDNSQQDNDLTNNQTDTYTLLCLKKLGLNYRPNSFDIVKKAYRKKISQFHPDKFQNTSPNTLKNIEELTQEINESYTYLKRIYSKSNI